MSDAPVRFATRTVRSWGLRSSQPSRYACPDSVDALRRLLADTSPDGFLARGCGRSYGDVGLNSGGTIADMRALAAVESFDESTGTLVAGAGLTLRDTLRRFAPLGFTLPVCPGTGLVTLGGAIANDVHGKNHHRAGSFGEHVLSFDLLTPGGALVRVSRDVRPELFAATVGGLGLTGVVVRVAMRLERTAGASMRVTRQPTTDLDDLLDRLLVAEAGHEHCVGWIDATARGPRLGSGFVEGADPAPDHVPVPGSSRIRVPFMLPSAAINRLTVATVNALYRARIPAKGRSSIVERSRFLFPLDAVHDWNRLYGRRGLCQFQCVVPRTTARTTLADLLDRAMARPALPVLMVAKTLHHQGPGMLSFPMSGFSLAIDYARSPASIGVIRQLHERVVACGGRVYLAKDSLLSAAHFHAMYPHARDFSRVIRELDPAGRMRSDMGVRLGILRGSAT